MGTTVSVRDLIGAGPMDPKEAARILIAVAGSVGAVHARGALHRDLKPENVVSTGGAEFSVAGFGAAPAGTVQTESGPVPGTAAYMAPELLRGGGASEQSDVYALGVMLFEMLTGRLPFVVDRPERALSILLNDRVPPPSRYRSDVPAALDAVVLAATEQNRHDRTLDTAGFIAGLKRFLDPPPAVAAAPAPVLRLAAPPAGPVPRPDASSRASVALFTFSGLGLIFVLIIFLRGPPAIVLDVPAPPPVGAPARPATPEPYVSTESEEMEYRARLLAKQGHYARSVEAWMELLKRDPTAEGWLSLARLHLRNKQDAAAFASLVKATELESSNAAVHMDLALLLRSREPKLACRELDRAIEAGEATPGAYLGRARCLMAAGETRKALPDLEKALVLAPSEAEVHSDLINAYIALGDSARAEEAARRAVRELPPARRAPLARVLETALAKRAPTDPDTVQIAMELAGQTKDPAALQRVFERYVAAGGRDAKLLDQLATASWEVDPAKTEKVLRDALASAPMFGGLMTTLARFMIAKRQLPEAEALLDRAAKAQPELSEILEARARLHEARTEWARAEGAWRAYLARRPNAAFAHYGLGQALRMQGQAGAAAVEMMKGRELEARK